MDSKKIVNLITRVVGREKVNRRQREELVALIGMVLDANRPAEIPKVEVKEKVIEDANTMNKEDPNTIDLGMVQNFDIPKDINVEFEGMEGIKKIKIFPDGISEEQSTPAVA